jgi:hypothetical protein
MSSRPGVAPEKMTISQSWYQSVRNSTELSPKSRVGFGIVAPRSARCPLRTYELRFRKWLQCIPVFRD